MYKLRQPLSTHDLQINKFDNLIKMYLIRVLSFAIVAELILNISRRPCSNKSYISMLRLAFENASDIKVQP